MRCGSRIRNKINQRYINILNMKKFLLLSALAASLTASAITVDLSNAAVGGAFNPPEGWGVASTGSTYFSVQQGAIMWSLYGYSDGGYTPTVICTPPIEGTITFGAKTDEADYDDDWGMIPAGTFKVYEYSKDGDAYTQIRLLQSESGTDGWEQYSYNVTPGNCVGFALDGASIRNIQYEVSDISGASVRFSSIEAEGMNMVNYETNITVSLTNRTAETIAAGTYTVELLNGEEVIGTQTATPELIDNTTLSFGYTPHAEGTLALSARFTMGEEVVNSGVVNVVIKPESARDDIIIGTGGTMTKSGSSGLSSPIWNWDRKTWCQMVLTADYLDEWGVTPGTVISGLSFFGATGSARTNVAMKVYMQPTELTAITPGEAVTVDEANNVLNTTTYAWSKLGSESAPEAFPDMMFDTAYTYNGGNLLLIIYKEVSSYDSSTYINQDTSMGGQAIIRSSDSDVTTAPWKQCSGLGQLDFIVNKNVPNYTGTVKDSTTQLPIADAEISLTSANVLYNGVSDADGHFSIPVVQTTREYNVTVSKDDYQNYTSTVSFTDDEDVEATILLVSEGTGVKSLATDGLNIRVLNDAITVDADATLRIYSMNGTLLDTVRGSEVATRSLNAGVYILSVETATGTTTVRFIKK